MGVLLTAAPTGTGTTGYTLLVAADETQIAAAQRLRHQVFAEELGATLHSATPGLDVDEFDAYCDHLIVRDDATAEVVGTYRMLPPERAAQAGRRYSDGEFEMGALAPLRHHLVETGRSCVHPAHRSGAVINLMWGGIARYLHLNGYRWLGGCASVPLDDGGRLAADVWNVVQARHLSPPAMRVRPRRPWLSEPAAREIAPNGNGKRVPMPPLLHGYLRLGAWVCGEPAYDPDFRVADLYVLLSLDRVDPRYLRHFLGATP
jgi:putative hemolysin